MSPAVNKSLESNPWRIWQVIGIVAAVVAIYWPALHGGWQWDDDMYLTKNPLLNDPARLWKAWFVPGSFIEYYPIAQTVQWVQWQLWHDDTLGYHVTNVVLHIASALLVWRLLGKLRLRYAWLGGLLFAVHPAQVDSVAWIAELKNTLSLPPFLLAMCAWIDFEEQRRPRDYWIAFAWFVAAMLCKISMAPFAFFILLFAWWKRGRVEWTDAKAAAPFFIVAVVLAYATIYAGQIYVAGAPPESVPAQSPLTRLALGGSSLAFYLSILLWPVNLLPAYAKWPVNPPSFFLFVPWLVLAALVIWFWIARRSWGRHALLGLGFFVLFLAPFLGLNWVSYMDFTWVMNHFLYIPSLGLIALAMAGLEKIHDVMPKPARTGMLAAVGVIIVLLALDSRAYAGVYRDSEKLWSYTLQHDPHSFAAQNELGLALNQRGDAPGALEHFQQAAQIEPGFAEAPNNVGTTLLELGRTAEAIDQFQQAIKLEPNYALAYYDLGNALKKNGDTAGAIAQYRQALKLDPQNAEVENNLANTLLQAGQAQEAFTHFARAMQIDSGYAEAEYNWGVALLQSGDVVGSIGHFQQAITINPQYVEAHFNLGAALYQTGHTPEAVEQFQEVLKLRPDFTQAQTILAQLEALPAGR